MRVIATDLDGTLLDDDGLISPGNAAALERAATRGVRIVVATGRPVRWLHVLEPIAHLHPVVIASNGAALFDPASGRVTRVRGFDAGSTLGLVADLRVAAPGSLFGIERGDLFGCEPGSRSAHARLPGTLIGTAEEIVGQLTPVVKLLAFHDTLSSDALAARSAAAVGVRATVTHSLTHDEFGMVELSVPGITKAALLADLCAEWGLDASEVVAFGDMPNDEDMLQWAGRGFVMADGHRSLHERFTVVGTNADDGVGRQVLRLLDEG